MRDFLGNEVIIAVLRGASGRQRGLKNTSLHLELTPVTHPSVFIDAQSMHFECSIRAARVRGWCKQQTTTQLG